MCVGFLRQNDGDAVLSLSLFLICHFTSIICYSFQYLSISTSSNTVVVFSRQSAKHSNQQQVFSGWHEKECTFLLVQWLLLNKDEIAKGIRFRFFHYLFIHCFFFVFRRNQSFVHSYLRLPLTTMAMLLSLDNRRCAAKAMQNSAGCTPANGRFMIMLVLRRKYQHRRNGKRLGCEVKKNKKKKQRWKASLVNQKARLWQ